MVTRQRGLAEVVDDVLDNLVINTRNNTVDTAAKVAKLYGASDEVVAHILMLKNIGADDAKT